MWSPKHKPIISARIPWYEAIHQLGAVQMGYMRKLFESRPFLKMMPAQDILDNISGMDKNIIRAARGIDGSFIIVYSAYGNPINVKLEKLSANRVLVLDDAAKNYPDPAKMILK